MILIEMHYCNVFYWNCIMQIAALQEERGLLEARVRMMALKSSEIASWLQQVRNGLCANVCFGVGGNELGYQRFELSGWRESPSNG